MPLPKPTVVIFDMDGTTVRHLNPFVLHMLEIFDDIGFGLGRFFKWIFKRGAKGPVIPKEAEEEYKEWRKPRLYGHRILHKVRRKTVDEIVEPCPGIYLVLNLLQKNKIPLALASNGLGKGYGHEIIEKFALDPYFQVEIFREDVQKSKPHPDGLLKALEQMDLDLDENDVVWHIGDRHKDVKATIAAQKYLPCKTVPIAYGVNSAVAILESGISPDHIIMSYPDLYKKLNDMFDKANK